MTAAPSDDDNEEFNTPHLPERYQKTVKAKKQRRLKKQILMAAGIFLIIIVLYLLVNWAAGGIFSALPPVSFGQSPAVSDTVTPNISVTVTPSFTQGAGLASAPPQGVLPLERAVNALNADYLPADYTIRSADLVSRTGRFLYEFRIQPAGGDDPVITVFIDARTGKAYSPGEEGAKISRDIARQLAIAAFPSLHPDRGVLTFTRNDETGNQWDFILFRNNVKLVTGSLDADSGELRGSVGMIQPEGRPAEPAIDAVRARSIADRYITEHNGGQLPVNMSIYRYDPVITPSGTVAGRHVFTYERTFQDYPTDVDGFTVMVDAVTGEVIGYLHQWTTPEHAFFAVTEPGVIRREATFAVMQKAKEEYPNAIAGLRIISAEIRWKNRVPYGTVTRPGSIPLGWKVVFDDDFIRGNASATPGVAWVDVQSGDFIAFDYRH